MVSRNRANLIFGNFFIDFWSWMSGKDGLDQIWSAWSMPNDTNWGIYLFRQIFDTTWKFLYRWWSSENACRVHFNGNSIEWDLFLKQIVWKVSDVLKTYWLWQTHKRNFSNTSPDSECSGCKWQCNHANDRSEIRSRKLPNPSVAFFHIDRQWHLKHKSCYNWI